MLSVVRVYHGMRISS